MPLTLAGASSPAGATSPGSNLGGLSAALGDSTTADLSPGSITHVWLIILENKSYNSEFSGVNGDTYLWQTLPSQGALVQNYFGTGHTSMDNYISLVSGQAPQFDTQNDCSDVNSQFSSNTGIAAGGTGGIVDAGAVGGHTSDWTLGQAVSNFGPNHSTGGTATQTNGCTYPTNVATLFDQFNQAGVTWKGYAQDLGGAQQIGATSFQANSVPGREDQSVCGAPGNPDGAQANPVSNPTYLSGGAGFPVASQLVSSTATGGSTTTLVDSLQSWGANAFAGDEVIITGGTGTGQSGTIASNTATTLTLSGSGFSKAPGAASAVAPDATSTYIVGVKDTSSYTAASLVAGTGNGPDGQPYSANNPEFADQYVGKHFPFPWFESLTGVGGNGTSALTEPANGGTNCDTNHIANLDSPVSGLAHDLQGNNVPNFSWITPDNCSDGHDASCKGNNLSGAFGLNADGTINLNDPIYAPSTTAGANCTASNGSLVDCSTLPAGSQIPSYDPEATTPRNYTGGTYAADLFLAYYVPLIKQSAAYQHGLIDVTFDEGEPSFLYGGNTFNNIPTTGPTGPKGAANAYPNSHTGTAGPSGTGPEDGGQNGSTSVQYPNPPAVNPIEDLSYGPGSANPGATSQFGADSLFADAAGESFYDPGTQQVSSVRDEPTGPNSPLATDANGYQEYPGPGFNLDIDKPPACAAGGADASTGNCIANEVLGDANFNNTNARTDVVTSNGSVVNDNTVAADDTGRELTSATVGGNALNAGSAAYDNAFQVNGGALPAGDAVYVGQVTQLGPAFPANSGGSTLKSGSFQLIDDNGNSVTPTGAVTSVTLSGECDPGVTSPTSGGTNLPSTCSGTATPDPLFDVFDPTPGGGDTGTVLLSPYIAPGTVSTVDYNHYSTLRTLEDLFDVRSCTQASTGNAATDVMLTVGTVCGGIDGEGHLGYAAQVNLDDFGMDVFTESPGNNVPESPLTIALPLVGLAILGAVVIRRRRSHPVAS